MYWGWWKRIKTRPNDPDSPASCIRDGLRVVIYDRNGSGRVGLYGAALLGRLYGLNAENALSRLQRYHDQQIRLRSNERGVAPVTCPETAAQSDQVCRNLSRTSRPLYDSWALHSQFGREQCFRQRRGYGLPRWIDRYKKKFTRSGTLGIALETSDTKHQVRTPRDGEVPWESDSWWNNVVSLALLFFVLFNIVYYCMR